MGEVADRWRTVAAGFTERVGDVPEGAWGRAAPCKGWTAADVVGHVLEWMPPFLFDRAPVAAPDLPPADADPLAAWTAFADAVQRALDDPAVAGAPVEVPQGPPVADVEELVAVFFLSDVLVHTWDLARATGQDEALDPDEVARALAGIELVDEDVLVASGHFGPRVPVADDADPQTRLLACTGRQP